MFGRLIIYFKEMFPVSSILGTMVTAVTIQLIYLRLYGVRVEPTFQLLIPAFVLTLISLLIRIMDEFKDYQDDLTNFPDRPLPSGKVKKSDLKALGIFCVVAIIFLSSTSKPLLIWALITLCFTGLMLKWFFIEKQMRASLILAFISHHPIVLFNFFYLVLACMHLDPSVGTEKIYFILPICLVFTNWEVLRKVRAPEQENSYTTYSKILGPRVAISIALLLQLIFIVGGVLISRELAVPHIFIMGFVILQLVVSFPSLRFLFSLKVKGTLKQQAEIQILSVIFYLLVIAIL